MTIIALVSLMPRKKAQESRLYNKSYLAFINKHYHNLILMKIWV